jgi:hypothetical protein
MIKITSTRAAIKVKRKVVKVIRPRRRTGISPERPRSRPG